MSYRMFCVLLITSAHLFSQEPRPWSGSEIANRIERLSVLASVLYVAAHPDDENTAFLATMANGYHARTAYLAMTRGEGGQNLIGPEQGAMLGLIRSQELLAARRIDGAEQLFTRAVDFGYSKTLEETVRFWGREEIVSDIVHIIRTFKPDVIVARFTPERGGHGNHVASAALTGEAFDAASDASKYQGSSGKREQWSPKRLVWNGFGGRQGAGAEDSVRSVLADLGAYDPDLGLSYSELAGQARTMHKSQGFGASQNRGSLVNGFVHVKGEEASSGLFDGVETSWKRVPGSERVAARTSDVQRSFDPRNPSAIVPALLRLLEELQRMPDDHWVRIKIDEVSEMIVACSGLWVDVLADRHTYVRGDTASFELQVVNRADTDLTLAGWSVASANMTSTEPEKLNRNVVHRESKHVHVSTSLPYSQPFWLRRSNSEFRYELTSPTLVGVPHPIPVFSAKVTFRTPNGSFGVVRTVRFRSVDPVDGEVFRPVRIAPRVAASFLEPAIVHTGAEPRSLSLSLLASKDLESVEVRFEHPAGWSVDPDRLTIGGMARGERRVLEVRVSAPAGTPPATLRAVVRSEGEVSSVGMTETSYKHIPIQTLFPPAESKLVRADVVTHSRRVGYIVGAGDEIPSGLRQMGCEVTELSDDDLTTSDLSAYDAIVAGIRAYNTRPILRSISNRLKEYMQAGGTYVVQYMTVGRGVSDSFAPYPLSVGRERVTEENAVVRLLDPSHPVLTTPNQITDADFGGWVQERGLYFAASWDPAFKPLLASHDTGENDLEGSLLVADVGRGAFVYTGLSFFRQIPAGVPGAFRLFANIISYRNGS